MVPTVLPIICFFIPLMLCVVSGTYKPSRVVRYLPILLFRNKMLRATSTYLPAGTCTLFLRKSYKKRNTLPVGTFVPTGYRAKISTKNLYAHLMALVSSATYLTTLRQAELVTAIASPPCTHRKIFPLMVPTRVVLPI